MEIKSVTEKVNKLVEDWQDYRQQNQKSGQRLSEHEERLKELELMMNRPAEYCDHEVKDEGFVDYVRSGNSSRLETKSLYSGDNDSGGYLITPELDKRIINKLESLSPLRKLCKVEKISSNVLELLLEDKKFEAGWVNEVDERKVTENAKLTKKRISVHELFAQPRASQRLLDDAEINLENWLTERIAYSFAQAENSVFIGGDGEGKPTGMLSYSPEIVEHVNTEDVGIGMPDILNLINTLDERYLGNATLLVNRQTLAILQKLRDENGRFIWQPAVADKIPATIFGVPVICCGELPNPEQGRVAAILADFNQAYRIVDRKGISIMRDPYTDKPFVKFYATKRVGGDVVDTSAMKFLAIKEE